MATLTTKQEKLIGELRDAARVAEENDELRAWFEAESAKHHAEGDDTYLYVTAVYFLYSCFPRGAMVNCMYVRGWDTASGSPMRVWKVFSGMASRYLAPGEITSVGAYIARLGLFRADRQEEHAIVGSSIYDFEIAARLGDFLYGDSYALKYRKF